MELDKLRNDDLLHAANDDVSDGDAIEYIGEFYRRLRSATAELERLREQNDRLGKSWESDRAALNALIADRQRLNV